MAKSFAPPMLSNPPLATPSARPSTFTGLPSSGGMWRRVTVSSPEPQDNVVIDCSGQWVVHQHLGQRMLNEHRRCQVWRARQQKNL